MENSRKTGEPADMKYTIESGSRTFKINLKKIFEKDAQQTYEVNIDEKEYKLDCVPGHVLINDSSIEYEVTYNKIGLPQSILLAERQVVPVNIQSIGGTALQPEKKFPLTHAEQTGKIKAPMNGQIVKIKVLEGDKVKLNQILLILEAMKMENEITSPFEGTVKLVNVSEGQTVNHGDLLLEII